MSTRAAWRFGLAALGVIAVGCAGEMDAPTSSDGPDGDADEVSEAPVDAEERAGDTDVVVDADVNVTAASDALAEPSCLTFYAPEDTQGSLFEGGLAAATTAPRTVFLNRRGGRYTQGRNDSSVNTSSIPGGTVNVAAYEGTDADWNTIVSCVRDQFSAYNVTITDQDPGSLAHIEAVVGDGPAALGLPSGVGGISPFNCGVIERSIVYVFSRVLGSVRQECEVIAHEVGHSFGLEHEFLCQDPMTYLSGCGAKTFQDVDAQCGTDRAVSCECGSPTQNTVEKLFTNVGAAGITEPPPPPPPTGTDAPPQVSVIAPQNGAALAGNTNLAVTVQASDDKGVADVRLLWEFNGLRTFSCKSPQNGATCSISGNRYTFRFAVGTGARAFTAEAVDTANQTTRSSRVSITLTTTKSVDAAPSVSLTSPTGSAILTRGARFSVRATATDDRAVREVNLQWKNGTTTTTFRLNSLGNDTFGVDLTLSSTATPGTRTLTVVAVDDAGQSSPSTPITIEVR